MAVLAERLEAVRPVEVDGEGRLAASGKVTLSGEPLEITVLLGADFPAALPTVALTRNPSKRVPHVSNSGVVCFDRSSGLVIDRHDPAGVVRQSLGRALEILEAGLSGRNHQDFITEFKPTWRDIAPESPTAHAFSLVEPQGQVRIIHASYSQRGEGGTAELTCFLETPDDLKCWGQAIFGKEPQVRCAAFVPLRAPVRFRPPPHGRAWASSDVRDFLEANLDRGSWLALRDILRLETRLPVLISVPRDADSQALVAIEPRGAIGKHPLIGRQDAQPPLFHTVTRLDRGYLLPRGGAGVDPADKRVLVVGCGSLGSRVAELLGAAGVGRLTLVDPDIITTDNLYRHLLSALHVGLPKVVGLQMEFQLRFPHLRVDAVRAYILDVVRQGEVALEAFDLVVAATGEPSVELALNARLRGMPAAPPAIFTWVEAYGLGGHALLARPDQAGCPECLICPRSHPETPLYNRASFAAASQPRDSGRDLDGCGGAFTPFSALDAARTAELAARMALKSLEGSLTRARLESWRGDPERFVAAGFTAGDRSSTGPEHPVLPGDVFARPDCPACGGGA